MILEEFFNEASGNYCYLVSSEDAAEAALIDPLAADVDAYTARISERNLKLVYVLQTGVCETTAIAAERLRLEAGGRWVAPRAAAAPEADIRVGDGDTLALGNLVIRVGQCPDNEARRVSYRVGHCFFRGDDVVVAGAGVVRLSSHTTRVETAEPESDEQPEEVSPEAEDREESAERLSPTELAERIADEARRSLRELPLTPKEVRVLEAYLSLVGSGSGGFPSARELADELEGITKRDLHVQIHNIRRKQLDGGCLPVMLAGQITKWLKDVQDEPDYTSHEREFLQAYLALGKEFDRPPTGDEIVAAFAGKRSLQWVRKRVQTIRAKQTGYGKQPLLMSRRGGGISRARSRS